MKYSEKQIESLRLEVGKRLSKKRFKHTIGVEKMAVLIGERIMPEAISELRAAALLHDISKEYSEAEQIMIMNKHNIELGEGEIFAPALWHSITGPKVIEEDFPEYASKDVLSSVYNHTVGSPDMSVFDEIVLLSDYIEEGRSYDKCVSLRDEFLIELQKAKSLEEGIISLHKAVAKSLDNNIKEFISRGKSYHKRTELTRDAIYSKIERQNNG